MQASFLSAVLLPLALGVIMMGLGLSLKIDDFKRVLVLIDIIKRFDEKCRRFCLLHRSEVLGEKRVWIFL